MLDYLRRSQNEFLNVIRPGSTLFGENRSRRGGCHKLTNKKSDHDLRIISIVGMTTSEDEIARTTTYESPANCCVPKLADFEQLIKVVRSIEVLIDISPASTV